MSEENKKIIRLSKVAKEFNIGVGTAIEYLTKKGYEVENSPNTKITEEEYQLLKKDFQSDKALKDKAENLVLGGMSKVQEVTIEQREKATVDSESIEPEDEGLIIKNFNEPLKKDLWGDIVADSKKLTINNDKAEETKVSEVKEIKKEPLEEIQKKEVKAQPEVASVREEVKEKPKESKEEKVRVEEKTENEIPVAQQAQVETKKDMEGLKGFKVVDKIDLDQFDPKKKSAKKAEQPKEAEVTPEPEKPVEVVVPVEEHAKEEKPDSRESNFVATNYVKLKGPRITGQKVDLSQFEKKPKPVASSKEDSASLANKKKRKRIKEDANKNMALGAPKPAQKGMGGNPSVAGKNEKNWAAKKDKNVKKTRKEVVVDEQEIEKQIKETLAHLTSVGKSKTSKHKREKRQHISANMELEHERMMEEQKILKVTEYITANELATMMNVPVNEIISTCMTLGLFVSINQRLNAEPISILAEEYGFKVDFVDAEVMEELEQEEDKEEDLVERNPIVTVMGHVDHGKTSLLDYIRNSNVIAGEAGGITQHIGSYEVTLENGKRITFLDTPGHEAFTAMRARGAKLTDIAIIVIAADDKVMPQTVEAINHAQAANVPIVFAINKIDKPTANPDKIKTELADMNLLVEEWGGKYQSQDISAKKGLNVDALLEKVLLEAEMLELKANPAKRAKGTVIESALDKGRGYVAKILIQNGSVKIGDPIVAGATHGRVKAMYNERNVLVKQAGPSQPVLLLGLDGAPQAGDSFNVTASEKEAKDAANRRLQLQREMGLRSQKHITLDEIGRRIAIGDFKELNVIVKGDVDGSIEALAGSLLKLSTEEVQVNVIHKSVGQITESDVLLASASEAIIVGFQVRPSVAARKLAESEQIDIRLYSIIYDAINELKDAIEGMLSPEIQEKIVANLEIKEIFKISKVGTIAGCIVLDGKLSRNTKIRIIRDGIVVFTGKLGSLRRFKDDVKEVTVGQDCGLNVENFNDIKVGDIIEGYEQIEVKRTL